MNAYTWPSSACSLLLRLQCTRYYSAACTSDDRTLLGWPCLRLSPASSLARQLASTLKSSSIGFKLSAK
jgi:hypothetical protein